jgi:hypothetical protein
VKKTLLSLVVLLVVLSGAWAEESTNRQNEWISVSWSASYDGQPEQLAVSAFLVWVLWCFRMRWFTFETKLSSQMAS